LHPEEIDYWSALRFEKRQQSYLLGRYAAKQAISSYDPSVTYSDILIKAGVFECPVTYYPSSKRVQITLSHSQNLGAALAFPEAHPMGIDLEYIQPDHKITVGTVLTHNEKMLISSYPYITAITSNINRSNSIDIVENTLYTIFWTIKEALSKALRTGMMTPFEIYAIKNILPQDNFLVCEFENFAQYQALSFLLDKQVCSIVYPKQTRLTINIPLIQGWISKKYSP
jgi:4'-phosphopantetheinyl transferase